MCVVTSGEIFLNSVPIDYDIINLLHDRLRPFSTKKKTLLCLAYSLFSYSYTQCLLLTMCQIRGISLELLFLYIVTFFANLASAKLTSMYICDLNFLHFHKEKVVFLFFGLRNIRISTERYVITHYHVYR